MLKLASQSQDAYKLYQQVPVLDRKNIKKYQQLLNPQDFLYQEINRILITHQSGIHQLSTGQKINATKITLLGGGKSMEKFSVEISGKQDSEKHYFQAPEGKRITGHGEPRFDGREEDIKLITANSTLMRGSVKQKDSKDWERAGGGEVEADFGAFGGGLGAHGDAKSKDQKEHEEEYSDSTVILEVKAKNPGFLKSMKSVIVSVDVDLEDISEKREICKKELEALVQGGYAGRDAIAMTCDQPASQEVVDQISKVSAKVIDVVAKGDLRAYSNLPLVASQQQVKDQVEIEGLHSEIDRIKAEIKESESKEEEFIGKLENAKTDRMQEFYSKKLDEVNGELKKLKTRKQELERQIDGLLKREGKEEEKK